MDVLELPDRIAIGGAEARAGDLLSRSERTLRAALALLRGGPLPEGPAPIDPPPGPGDVAPPASRPV